MKKNYILFVCAAAALMFASCQKEGPATQNSPAESDSMEMITATTMQTKTMTQDGVNVLWEKGDGISLFSLMPNPNGGNQSANLCGYTTTLQSPNANATFVKNAGDSNYATKANGKYVAFYMKGATNTTKSRNLNASFTLDDEQVAKNGGDFASSLMLATSENSDFVFSHMVSYLKFVVDEDTTPFNKLTVTSVDESQYVVTRIMVDFASDLTVQLHPVNPSNGTLYSQSSKTVSITTDDKAVFAPGTYYMAINPDTYQEGLNLTFETATATQTITTPTNIVLAPGDVADLGTIGSLELETVEKLQIATVFEENGKKQGVVYWIDPQDATKGKILSVSSAEKVKWSTSLLWEGKTTNEDGLLNTNDIMADTDYVANPSDFPAIKYCADLRTSLGGNWYVPAIDELKNLYNIYYGLSIAVGDFKSKDYRLDASGNVIDLTTKKAFDAALKLLGETTTASLDGDADGDGTSDDAGYGTDKGVAYWTSKVNTGGWTQYARFGSFENGNIKNTFSTATYYVRCVRDVELQ